MQFSLQFDELYPCFITTQKSQDLSITVPLKVLSLEAREEKYYNYHVPVQLKSLTNQQHRIA